MRKIIAPRAKKKISWRPLVWRVAFSRKLVTIFLLLIVLAIFAYLFLQSDLFSINKVNFHWVRADRVPQQQMQELIKSGTLGENLITFKDKSLAEYVVDYSLTILSVDFRKQWPNELGVYITGRAPLAIVVASSSAVPAEQESFVIGETGLIFDLALEDEILPRISLNAEGLGLGTELSSQEVAAYLEVLKETVRYNLPLVWLDYSAEGCLTFQLRDGPVVLLNTGSEESISASVSSLRLVLEKYRIEGRKLAKVDLRFNKPVVSFR